MSADAHAGPFTRRTILLVVGAIIVIGLAVGLPLGLTSSGSHHATRSTTAAAGPALSHASYAKLYHSATLGKTTTTVLKQWPNPPYQRYHSGSGLLCYEWWDKPVALYNLCFNAKGVLEDKAIE